MNIFHGAFAKLNNYFLAVRVRKGIGGSVRAKQRGRAPSILAWLIPFCGCMAIGAFPQVGHVATVDEHNCGVYDKSLDDRRNALLSQQTAEKRACDARIDQVRNTFAWFEHCVVKLDDKYRPHIKQLENEIAQHGEEARRCVRDANNKREAEEKRAKIQEELTRRSDQQQQALRAEQFNREMARGNAERDAYNRRAQDEGKRRAAQFQAQQAQQAAAQQVEYQRQQAMRQAAAEKAQRYEQERTNIGNSLAETMLSSRLSAEQSYSSAVAETNQLTSAFNKESGDLARIIEAVRAEEARITAAGREVRNIVSLDNVTYAANAQTAQTETPAMQYQRSRDNPNPSASTGAVRLDEGTTPNLDQDCARRSSELAQINIPGDAPARQRLETTLYLTTASIELIDWQCPGASPPEARVKLKREYDSAQQACKNYGLMCKPTRHY